MWNPRFGARRARFLLCAVVVSCFWSAPAVAEAQRVFRGYNDAEVADEPRTGLTIPWALIQLVPSFQLAYGDDGVAWGLRWQTSPFLISWGIRSPLTRVRLFTAEPLVRYSGSAELFVSGEYFHLDGNARDRLMFRGGVRVHVPVHHQGENVAWSFGVAYARLGEDHGPSFETGVHIFSGVLGLSVVVNPWHSRTRGALVFNLRFF
ncbi:MAG: hypothetical protein AAGF12_21430 [Myxococcota bacterium]